jgi:hypothetical protein
MKMQFIKLDSNHKFRVFSRPLVVIIINFLT